MAPRATGAVTLSRSLSRRRMANGRALARTVGFLRVMQTLCPEKGLRRPPGIADPAILAAAAVGLSATIAIEPQSRGIVATGVARSLVGGVILGSNVWPSVPVDVQARLLLPRL
jgi:hypothetical protein